MTVSTTSAAFYITPVVFKTFFNHVQTKGRKFKDGDERAVATDDVFFDEAFHIVKAFIQMGTENTVESLQAFTNTHVLAPYWAAVSPVVIPLSCCNRAADVLIDWFGPEDLKHVVGGSKWWQVRGLDGVDSEWVTEKEYLAPAPATTDKKYSTEEMNIIRMDHLDTVMLYVHGGGYFWGSINTHRYQIIRYARKINGRCFAVNYRKAPQYPWPCPLQDVLAAWFYLTEPPPGALHKPIPPSKIVIAGDSAGGGLCIAALTVLRDMGYEQPAGAVLISPWVDLTHSFPSVMKNTATDIIPPYGFIHKASPIWPIHPLPPNGEPRVVPTKTNPPPAPGHADTLRPSQERLAEQVEQRTEQSAEEGHSVHAGDLEEPNVNSQAEMLSDDKDEKNSSSLPPHKANGDVKDGTSQQAAASDNDERNNLPQGKFQFPSMSSVHVNDDGPDYDDALSFWEPKPPKVLMEDPNEQPLELRSQIQLYAMNEQLTHPLVSPVLQGSLGNLCPLYILAGDGEVLRDEIMYLAHKAANPSEYPTRKGVLKDAVRQRENAEKFTKPTRVHLQVFDGMCHVLTVFTFTDSATYAYRSIAEFVKHVTTHDAAHLERNPFPEFHLPPADITDSASEDEHRRKPKSKRPRRHSSNFLHFLKRTHGSGPAPMDPPVSRTDVDLYRANEEAAKIEVKSESTAAETNVDLIRENPSQEDQAKAAGDAHATSDGQSNGEKGEQKAPNGEASDKESKSKDIPGVIMLRERVDILGQVRPMEPKEEIEALKVPARLIGIIKEGPVKRWLTGQELWDKRFHKAALHTIQQREHYEKKYATVVEKARSQGLELVSDHHRPAEHRPRRASTMSNGTMFSTGEVDNDRRYGPFDLGEERPASSAIVGRRDNRESIVLVQKCIYYTAPATHKNVPKRTTADAIHAAFDRDDNPVKPPRQSVSEQQTESNILPMHGLRIWQNILTVFMRKSSAKSAKARRKSMPNLRTSVERHHGRQSTAGESSADS